jgi:hypothetical protein
MVAAKSSRRILLDLFGKKSYEPQARIREERIPEPMHGAIDSFHS